jgi:hypothetical protein
MDQGSKWGVRPLSPRLYFQAKLTKPSIKLALRSPQADGAGAYVHDLQMLGMLHAVFARSTRQVGLSGIDGIMFMPKLFFLRSYLL